MPTTIAAISTPLGMGGIGVIRVSGVDAKIICDKIFVPFGKVSICNSPGYKCLYGYILNKDSSKLDDVIVSVFNSPHSYTGEDVVEISCHGGIYICRKIMELLLDNGAVAAMPGEFTKRAFLNNKMDLTRAESVIDIINSSSEASNRAARQIYEGSLFNQIKSLTDNITSLISHLEAWADYPEEDIDELSDDNLMSNIQNYKSILQKLLDNYENGKIIKDGINTVIVGKSNVGKSTLMNLLSGCERSIVTDIPGTTRDIIEEKIIIGDYTINLCDTAGFRDTEDKIEQIGLEKARDKSLSADLVLAVFDYSSPISDYDKNIINDIKSSTCIAIINKIDLEKKLDCDYIKSNFNNVIEISAKNSTDTDTLKTALNNIFNLNRLDSSSFIMINERQKHNIKLALNALDDAYNGLISGITPDAVTVCLEETLSYLLELTGEKVSDKVIDSIFSKFCVGK